MYYIINLSSWKFVLYLQNVNFLDICLLNVCFFMDTLHPLGTSLWHSRVSVDPEKLPVVNTFLYPVLIMCQVYNNISNTIR